MTQKKYLISPLWIVSVKQNESIEYWFQIQEYVLQLTYRYLKMQVFFRAWNWTSSDTSVWIGLLCIIFKSFQNRLIHKKPKFSSLSSWVYKKPWRSFQTSRIKNESKNYNSKFSKAIILGKHFYIPFSSVLRIEDYFPVFKWALVSS